MVPGDKYSNEERQLGLLQGLHLLIVQVRSGNAPAIVLNAEYLPSDPVLELAEIFNLECFMSILEIV